MVAATPPHAAAIVSHTPECSPLDVAAPDTNEMNSVTTDFRHGSGSAHFILSLLLVSWSLSTSLPLFVPFRLGYTHFLKLSEIRKTAGMKRGVEESRSAKSIDMRNTQCEAGATKVVTLETNIPQTRGVPSSNFITNDDRW